MRFVLWAVLPAMILCNLHASEQYFKNVFNKHCMECHDTDTKKGDFDIEKLSFNLSSVETIDKWVRIVDLVKFKEMPTKEKFHLPASEYKKFLATAADFIRKADIKYAVPSARKLNNFEIQNSLKDIFGVDLDYNPFLAPDRKLNGFDNQARLLKISEEFMVNYLRYIDRYLEVLLQAKKVEEWALKDMRLPFPSIMSFQKKAKLDGLYEISFDVIPFGLDNDLELFVKAGFKKMGRGSPVQDLLIRKFVNLKGSDHRLPELFVTNKNKKMTVKTRRYLLNGEMFQVFTSDGRRYKAPKGKDKDSFTSGFELKNIKISGPVQRAQALPKTKTELLSYLQKTLPLVYKRFLSEAEWASVKTLIDNDIRGSFVKIIRKALVSPEFLFNRKSKNINYHLASRMSLMLWRSSPDIELLNAARDGKLLDAKSRLSQASRMVENSKFDRFLTDFLDQWFEQERYYSNPLPTRINKEFYDRPQLVLYSSLSQNHKFFQRVLKENLSVMDLIDSDWTYLNRRLEKLYGMKENLANNEMKLVKLPKGSISGGLLNQAALMRITSVVDETSPVKRGVWMAENIMSVHIPDPPDDVPDFIPDTSKAKTLKEQFLLHRSMKECAGCHAKFDPIGFVFESFDPIGRFRTHYYPPYTADKGKVKMEKGAKGVPVDTESFKYRNSNLGSMSDLKNYILKNPQETFVKAYLDKLTAFSLGRKTHFQDRHFLEMIMKNTASKGYRALDVLSQFIASDLFEMH